MSEPFLGKVRIEDFLAEDPRLVRLIYRYEWWAAFWLVLATLIGLLLAARFAWPDLLPISWLSFGRLRPVHTNSLFWGWSSLALVGLTLYVVPRTSRAPLYSIRAAYVTLVLWNLAVAFGAIALAAGISNGSQEYREYIWPIMGLFVIGLVIQTWNLYQTIAHRGLPHIYISNWYILSGFLWTAVLVITAYLPWFDVGLSQTAIQGYYMHVAVGMWFTPLALGLTYYFLPRFLNRPIYSYSLGVLGFWTQLVFYTLIGGHHFVFSAIPWALQTIAIVFSVAMLITVWSGSGNFLLTMQGGWRTARRSYSLPFLFVGVLGYLLASSQGTIEAFRSVQTYLHLTNFTVGHSHFTMYAFIAFMIWGGLYGLMPRLTHREPSLVLVGIHFWLSLVGIVIYVAALSIGGYLQGASWVRGEPFLRSVELMAPFWLWRAVGGLLMFFGHVVFFVNLYAMRPIAEIVPRVVAGEEVRA